ncbi:hypothetical protein ABPG77_003529 [Micractinium sp. CCAP 211/92]
MSSPKHDPAEPLGPQEASPVANGSPKLGESPPDSPREGSDGGGDGSPERHHKHKKEKKEKKHKDKDKKRHKEKKHKEKRRHHEREGEADPEAGTAAEEPAAAGDEGRGGAAPEPAPLPSADTGAAKPASAAAAADGAEEEEEGELPGELGGEASDRLGGEKEQHRRSRSPSQGRHRHRSSERGRRDRTRSRTRSRSPRSAPQRSGRRSRSRSPPREPSRGPGVSGPHRDRSREGRPRGDSRRRSRSPAERRRSRSVRRSRSPAVRPRSPPRRAPPPPPSRDGRGGYLDRRPGYDRRPDYDRRDRYGGPRDGRPDDRRPGWDDRRRLRSRSRGRSRSRSRDTRKRSRSDERRQQAEQQKQEDDEEFQARVAAALEAQQGEDEDRLIEERRRRRAEILAKHRSQQDLAQTAAAPTATAKAAEAAQQQQQQQEQQEGGRPQAGAAPAASGAEQAEAPGSRPASAAGEDDGAEVDLSDHEDVVLAELGTTQQGALNIFREGGGAEGGGGPESAAPSEAPRKSGTGEAVDSELQKRLDARKTAEPSMFDDDADDIFAATPTDVKEKEAAAAAATTAGPAVVPGAGARKGLLDNYDDAEGYYNFQVGEVIGEAGGAQYEVYATHGKGVFSSVLRARDLSRRDHDTGTFQEVAIKVIRANETMYKAGQMERVILRKLSEADPEGKRHCIRQLGSFEYRNHLCLVFEPMDMNLRELTKRYGRGIGLSINAVRVYAQQMLVALYHLRNCGVLHADIKPDNILVNDRRTVVKLCDFGSAMFSGDNEITPYLVSRFYRAPEVILGLPYEYPMDMWSIGCVVYELFTGHILFPGKTNNEMLKLMMDVKGPFPKKMVKRAEFAFKHFEADPNTSFALLEEDPVTKRPVRRLISNPTIKKDFSGLLAGQSPDRRKLAQLVDLLERMMQLDPDKRITPKDALRHPFIKEPPSGAAGK